MFNLLQVQDRLKQLPDQELQQELRTPDPETQALVMSEVERRQRLRQGVPQGPKKSIYEQMLGMAGPPPPRFPPGGPPPGLAGMLPAQGQMGMGPGAAAPGPVPGSAGAGLMGMPGPALSPLAAMRPPGLAGGGEVRHFQYGGENQNPSVAPYLGLASPTMTPESPESSYMPLSADVSAARAAAPPSGMPLTGNQIRIQMYGNMAHQVNAAHPLIPPGLLWNIANEETGGTFNPDAIGAADDVGLMQITPPFAKQYGISLQDRHNPQLSYEAGARFFDENIPKHGVRGAVRRYNGSGPKAEAYADRIMSRLSPSAATTAPEPATVSPAGFPFGAMTPPAGEANGAVPAAVPPPDPYADAASELMKRYAELGPQKPQQITPEQWQAWQVKPSELQPAPKADYAAALDRAKQFLPNDGNYDKLQAQIDAMREASGARPLSLGEKLILIGAGMKNRWDFGGGIANEWQAEQNETQAARDRAMKLYGFQSDLAQMRERQQDAVMRLGQGLAESDQRTAAANAEAQNRALEANRVIQENAELTNMKLSDPERSLQDLTARVGLLGQFKNMQGYNLQADIGKAVSGDSQAQARVKLYMNMIHPGESTYQQDELYRKNRDDADRFYDQWMKEKSNPTNPDFARFQTLNEDQRREEFRKDPRAAQYLNYLGPISISSDTPGAPRRPGSP